MPPVSQAQSRAMYAAAEGRSTLGIPKAVGQEFTSDSAMSPEEQAQRGHKAKKKTWRGRNSAKRKGPKEHHAEAKQHMANAQKEPTPHAAMGHLFKAVRSLHAAKAASEPSGNALL